MSFRRNLNTSSIDSGVLDFFSSRSASLLLKIRVNNDKNCEKKKWH